MSSTTNSEGLHFHEGVENINENNKNTKMENHKMGRKSMAETNLAYVYSWGIISSNFSLTLL